MTTRFLPVGSYIQLHNMLNLPGPGSSKKWTCNGKPNATMHCVQYMVRTDTAFWLYVPAGHHKGWYEVPLGDVQYCKCEPPTEVLATLPAPVMPGSPAARLTAVTDVVLGLPTYDEQGNVVGRSAPLISA